jgi:hypothetical protein
MPRVRLLQLVVDGAERRHVEPKTQLADGDDVGLPPRRCGRCRSTFDGDPTFYQPARPDRWVCPRCRATPFGRHPDPDRRSPPASHRRHVERADNPTPVAGGPHARSTRSPQRTLLEVAQRVWQRSVELASAGVQSNLADQSLALLRTARHDADTMSHALGLGRSQARHPSNDETTRRGIRLLERAIAYLGVEPQPGEITRPGPH